MRTRIVVAALGALLLPTTGHDAEIKVLSTQAVEGAYRELVLQFEKASGHKVTTTFTTRFSLSTVIRTDRSPARFPRLWPCG